MKSFKPVANPFKKKSKPSRRVHGVSNTLREDGVLTKKHHGGLRSPKTSPGRSSGSKSRPARAVLSRCGSSSVMAPSQPPQPIDVVSRAASSPSPVVTKKRSRPSSRPGEPSNSGYSAAPIAEGEQSCSSGDDTVKVFVRIRPPETTDDRTGCGGCCVRQLSEESLAVVGTADATQFSFDHVAGPNVGQEKLFDVAGVPVVENCLRGYNSCVFAYGQTGSGKTYTMLGDLPANVGAAWLPSSSGLMPRIFQYLFAQIAERHARSPAVQYSCSCSLLEIYNETITDLLNPSATNLQLREDTTRGVYAEDLIAENVQSAQQAMDMLRRGSANRRVADTNMNSESSRSHCVLTCVIESKTTDENGFTNVLSSRLNLVDLAGSERQKSSGAVGGRLREASSINRSLSTLGLVIMSLTDAQHGRKGKHVPYRDSKLTFLLQDSLGGNSKTVMIANVNPSQSNLHETVSTLRFARRAKFIKNTAIVNEDLTADASQLKKEIARLKSELARYRMICEAALNNSIPGVTAPGGMPGIDNNPPAPSPVFSTSSSQTVLRSIPENNWPQGADWDSAHAYDIQLLQTRAEEAASRAVSNASRELEEVFARAKKDGRTKVARESACGRHTKLWQSGESASSSEDRQKLIATMKCNRELQGQLFHLGEHVAGLSKEKSILMERITEEQNCLQQAETRAKEALLEVARSQDTIARLTVEKSNIESQLKGAAESKIRIESQCIEMAKELHSTHQDLLIAIQDNKNLHLRNKQLEENVMGLMAEKENLLAKVKMLTASQQERASRGVLVDDGDDAGCNCSIEIVQLQGQLYEEKERTYKLMRQLEILTLQQDEEFLKEFGSCKDQLVALLRKLEEATKELNHLKSTLVERDSEMQDLQEYVDTATCKLAHSDEQYDILEGELRAQLLAKESLEKKIERLETELDSIRSAQQEGLEGGELLLVKSLQAELVEVRQENNRLSKGTEGKDSEICTMKKELTYLKAVASMRSLVSEVKPGCGDMPLCHQEVDYEVLQGSGARQMVDPGWDAMAGASGCLQSSEGLQGADDESTYSEIEVDMLEADLKPLGMNAPHGTGATNHSQLPIL